MQNIEIELQQETDDDNYKGNNKKKSQGNEFYGIQTSMSILTFKSSCQSKERLNH